MLKGSEQCWPTADFWDSYVVSGSYYESFLVVMQATHCGLCMLYLPSIFVLLCSLCPLLTHTSCILNALTHTFYIACADSFLAVRTATYTT